jgi:hypothetical protein
MPKGSELFLVDSSGWIEFLGGGPPPDRFAPYFEWEERFVVPEMVCSEVYKKLLSVRGSAAALRALRANQGTAGPARGANQSGPPIGHGRRNDLRNRADSRSAPCRRRRARSRLARSDRFSSRAMSAFRMWAHPADHCLPITRTTNVSGRTLSCVEPWPCLAVTVSTLCVFMSTVIVRAPDCVSISSSTLKLSGESS